MLAHYRWRRRVRSILSPGPLIWHRRRLLPRHSLIKNTRVAPRFLLLSFDYGRCGYMPFMQMMKFNPRNGGWLSKGCLPPALPTVTDPEPLTVVLILPSETSPVVGAGATLMLAAPGPPFAAHNAAPAVGVPEPPP